MRISDWSSDVCSSDRPYLEDALLQAHVAAFFDADKPVAAICHGVVLAARSISRRSGRSVLHGRRTTALTWSLERSAWNLTRFWGRFWDRDYYRTYAELRSEEHTSELQSLMRSSYAV